MQEAREPEAKDADEPYRRTQTHCRSSDLNRLGLVATVTTGMSIKVACIEQSYSRSLDGQARSVE
jgi:hypothetical protein